MAEKYLRGAEPLTIVRGAGGTPSRHIYRGQVLDPGTVDPADQERLVGDGFLEWVVRDGESWALAEDTATGSVGDPVSVGGAASLGPEPARVSDPGTLNVDPLPPRGKAASRSPEGEDAQVRTRREAAASKLPADGAAPHHNAHRDVWVEYGVKQGRDRTALEALSDADLKSELKPKG